MIQSNPVTGFFTLKEFIKQTDDLLPEEELKRMFKANNKANDGKMTFSDYIRMVVSKNTNFDLSDNTLNHIERIYISPRRKKRSKKSKSRLSNMALIRNSGENSTSGRLSSKFKHKLFNGLNKAYSNNDSVFGESHFK